METRSYGNTASTLDCKACNASKSRDPITITGRATDSGGLEEGVLSTKVMDTNFGHHLSDGGLKLQKL